jgi:hypothetical protein
MTRTRLRDARPAQGDEIVARRAPPGTPPPLELLARAGADARAGALAGLGNAGVARLLARQPATATRRVSTQGINLAKAERQNRALATRLGWEDRLAEFRPEWAALWAGDDVDGFADAVAAWQRASKIKPVDGILGRGSWARIRPIGEVIAERAVDMAESKKTCFVAAKERLTEGYKQATGEKLGTGDDADMFNWILKSRVDKMSEIPEEYRATGAPGALVYAGRGTFVSEAGIWDDKELLPGAALQVWGSRSGYESLVDATATGGVYGTSAVFVRYEGDDQMVVLHFDRAETWSRDSYDVFIGANLAAREEAED